MVIFVHPDGPWPFQQSGLWEPDASHTVQMSGAESLEDSSLGAITWGHGPCPLFTRREGPHAWRMVTGGAGSSARACLGMLSEAWGLGRSQFRYCPQSSRGLSDQQCAAEGGACSPGLQSSHHGCGVREGVCPVVSAMEQATGRQGHKGLPGNFLVVPAELLSPGNEAFIVFWPPGGRLQPANHCP